MADENKDKKRDLAYEQGRAYDAAVSLMKTMAPHASTEYGDYIITIAAEAAEGVYVPDEDGGLRWRIPTEHENQHIEIVVQDGNDHRFVPELGIGLTLFTEKGSNIASTLVPFVWHPFLHHYGTNIRIPGPGKYRFEVTVKTPSFCRHDEFNGKRYASAKVTLGPIEMMPARKEHGSE